MDENLDFLKETINDRTSKFFPNVNIINLEVLKNEDTNSISVSFNYNIINTGINDTLTIDFE